MKLSEIRKSSGMKAQFVADCLGISRVQLYNLEKGVNKIDINKIVKFSEVYRKPVDEILTAIKEADENEQ